MGRRIGVTRIMMHMVSMKVPSSKRSRNMNAMIKNLLDVMDSSQPANRVGTFCMDIIHPKGVATEIISMITPVVTTLSAATL